MKKRILSITLSLSMLFMLIPMSVFATDDTITGNGSVKMSAMSVEDFNSAIDSAPDGGTVELTGDVTLSSTVIITKNLTITSGSGGPYTISRGSGFTSYLLGENSAGKTLTLENVIIDGSADSVTAAKPLIIANAGNITLNAGTVLQNNKNGNTNGTGGAAQVQANCTLTMNGGTIKNCSGDYGGGVFVIGTFTMNSDSKIESCTGKYGGGVMVYTNGHFNLNGGDIYSNSSPSSSGGGVYVNSSGYFNMSDGSIRNNTSYASGGGVYATTFASADTTFTITGGTISGNKATASYGGGIAINKRNASISGATINNNESLAGGGGLYHKGDASNNYSLSVSDTSISGNKSTYQDVDGSYGGGGIYEAAYGTLLISGETGITSNLAHSDGGGIFIASNATAEINGTGANPVTISENRAYGFSGINENYSGGGGIFGCSDATLKLNGNVSIIDNMTDSYGGGIQGCTNYMNDGLEIQMGGLITIKGNLENYSNGSGDSSNVFLSLPITLTDSGLTKGSSVGIITQDDPCAIKNSEGMIVTPGHDVPFTTTETETTLYDSNRDYFFSDLGYPIGAGGTTGKCDYIMPPEDNPILSGSDKNVTYGSISGNLSVSYIENDKCTYSVQWYKGDTVNDDNLISNQTETTYTIPTNLSAGDHSFTVRVSAKIKQSSMTLFSDKTFIVHVAKAPLTVSDAKAKNRTYDGDNSITISGGTLNGLIAADENKVELSGNPIGIVSDINVGNDKKVTVTGYTLNGEKADNYDLTQPTDVKVNITKAPIIIQWKNIIVDYNGNVQKPDVTGFSGKVNSENVEVVVKEGKTEAGSYVLNAELTGTDKDNYTLDNPTSSFIIRKSPVTFSVSNNCFKADSNSHKATVSANIDNSKYKITYKLDGTTISDPTKPGVFDIFAEITDSNYRHINSSDGREQKIGVLTIYSENAPTTYTVNFNTDGGTEVGTLESAISGTVRILPTSPTKSGYTFAGWKYDGKIYQAGESFTQPKSNVEFKAVWEKNSYTVSGIVDQNGSPISGAVITLTLGSKQITQSVTDDDGKYSFTNLASGIYNLRAEWNGIIKTIAVEITSSNVTGQRIILPIGKTNSIVDIAPGTLDIVVGSLDKIFEDQSVYTMDDENTVSSGGSVEIRAEIAKSEDDKGQTLIEEELSHKESIKQYIDINLIKIVTNEDGEIESSDQITETSQLLTFVIPLPGELQGKLHYALYRSHEGEFGIESVQQLTSRANDAGEYIEVNSEKTEITVHAKKFSVYGIGYLSSEITLDANGGECEITTQLTNGEGTLESLPEPTRSGLYAFEGWFTEKNGGVKVTTDTVFEGNSNIYAQWKYTGTASNDPTNSGDTTKSPKTGDTSDMGMWIMILVLTAGTSTVAYRKRTDK